MTAKTWMMLAAAGSAAMLIGALGFQYLGEMPPCKMCYWQRYGHVGAALAGAVALVVPMALIAWLGAAAVFSSSAIGFYHMGVEQKWWEGPSSCTSQSIEGLSTQELIAQLNAAPMVRCDEIPWEMFGLSMAGWNMVVSFGLAVLWVVAARRA